MRINLKYVIRDELDRKDKSEIDLLHFVTPSQERLQVLVVEGNLCLPGLRERLPKAEIHAVTEDEDAPECSDYQALDIRWELLDYHTTVLPYEKEQFDYLLGARCLETADNPQDIAAGFNRYIKETGFFLTSFLNIRYWKILEDLQQGHFYYFCHHMFTRPEMERLLFASFYKSAMFTPVHTPAPPELLESLLNAGFENRRDDLEAELWLVKAARSTPEIAALKSLYTGEIRRQLAVLLRRLEYGIEPHHNLAALWGLCRQENIFPAYLAEFMKETIMHREALLEVLVADGDAQGMEAEMDELLDTLKENSPRDGEMLDRIAAGRRSAGPQPSGKEEV